MTDILGIDVSFAQTTTPKLDHLEFAIAKSSEGNFTDSMWRHHAAEIRKAGKPLGAYHFGRAEWSAHDQATLFLGLAGDADFLALDWEPSPSAHTLMSEDQARTFIKHVQSTGRKIGLYAAEHFPREYPKDAFGADWRWVANFSVQPKVHADMWQYGGTGIDRDRWMGTPEQFAAFVGRNEPNNDPVMTEGNPMTNLVPMTCHRTVDLAAGVVLYETPGGAIYTHLAKPIRLGLLGATGTHYHVADGDAGVYVKRTDAVVATADINVGA